MVQEGAGVTGSPGPISPARRTGRIAGSVITEICRVLNILGITVLLLMAAMTVVDVVGRLFKRPIVGSTEITEFMMVTIVFLCIGWCALKGRMITVDLITLRLSQRVQAILNSISLFIGLGVMVVITWRSFLETLAVQKESVYTIILHVPSAPFMWILSVGFAVLSLVMVAQLVQNLAKAAGK